MGHLSPSLLIWTPNALRLSFQARRKAPVESPKDSQGLTGVEVLR